MRLINRINCICGVAVIMACGYSIGCILVITYMILPQMHRDIREIHKKLDCIQLPACDTTPTPVLPRQQEGK